jgi:dipeptidyl aminopeptidase/acylaminoacyl peptidase
MKAKVALTCLFTLLIVGAAVGATEKSPLAELDVFQLEYASDPQISPDGDRIVYVRNSMDIMKDRSRSKLWIVDFDGTDHRKLTTGEGEESSPRWSPDGEKLVYVAGTEEGGEIFLRWMDSGQTAKLTQLPRPPRALVWALDGKSIAFSMLVPEPPPTLVEPPKKPEGAEWPDPPRVTIRLRHEADGVGYLEPGYYHLFVLPVEGGTPRQVTTGSFHHRGAPAWTPDGKSLVFSANRNPDWEHEFVNSEIYSVSLDDGSIRALTDRNGPDGSPAVSPDGGWIAYTGFDDKIQTYQVAELYVMNLDGGEKRVVTSGLDRSVSSPTWDAEGKGVYIQYDDQGNTKIGYVALDGDVSVLAGNLGGTSLGRPYGGGSFSVASNGRFAFTETRPEYPADVAVGQGGESRVLHVTRLNQDLLGYRDLGKVEEIWYESSYDQRRIQGWILTPPEFDPNKLYPLLLEIHGGPIANYGDRFTAEFQLYAAAGYVVFYANPRGSTGYGEEFGNLLYHDYPGQDYDDLMSGVDVLIAKGYIDEDNLFVTGGSAGGIMTAWIVGKTSRFRAAVVAKPVINWYSKVLVADNYYAYHKYRYPGSPWENPEAYMKYSPISLVGNVSTPSMVLVGTSDLRTPLSESKQFYHALKLRKVDTALVEIPGASHGIARRPSQLITKVAHVLAWFEKYRK